MASTYLLPTMAALFFLVFALYVQFAPAKSGKHAWIFPAMLSLMFFLFSAQTMVHEGALGFWTEHTRNRWGNQIWFDLLFATGIGWLLMVPQGKQLNMRLTLWLMLIASTGSVGFLAMVARMLFLQERAAKATQAHAYPHARS